MWKCHNVTIINFVTFLGFCHAACFFLVFLAKPKMSEKCRNVTNVKDKNSLQVSLQTFRKYLRFEATFRCRLARTNPES